MIDYSADNPYDTTARDQRAFLRQSRQEQRQRDLDARRVAARAGGCVLRFGPVDAPGAFKPRFAPYVTLPEPAALRDLNTQPLDPEENRRWLEQEAKVNEKREKAGQRS